MKRPLTRKLIVKEELEQGADPWQIRRTLEERSICITRITLWRDMQEVRRYSKDELIYKYEMADIERRKVLRERQKRAVAAKNSLRIVKPPSEPANAVETSKKNVPGAAYSYQVMRGKELEDFFNDIRDDRYRMPDF